MRILPKDDGKSVGERMSELEKDTDETVEVIEKNQSEMDAELSMDYCFCVVFETKAERNAWLKRHALEDKMKEGGFFLAKDFID